MDEWKEYKLGEVAVFGTEKLSSSLVSLENYISTENMLPNKGGIEQADKKPENGLITHYCNGDILISNIRPYFKKIWLADRTGGCSNDVLCIRPKIEDLNNTFLFYVLSQDDFFEYVMLGSKGCKMPRGDKSHIMNFQVVVPSLSEQKRIVSILGSLDDKIDLLHQENKTLEAMAETLFRKWFIEEVRQDVLLGNVVETTSGGTPSRKCEEYYQNGIIDWVKSKELNRSYLLKTEEKITVEAVGNSSAKFLPANSVLIAMYGATVGEYAIIAKEMTCNQAVCALKPNDNYPYTYLYLWAKFMQDEFLNLACGAAQQNISQVLIKQQQVCSDVDAVKQFHSIVEPFFEKLKQNEMQLSSLEEMKHVILPKLMNNELNINEL